MKCILLSRVSTHSQDLKQQTDELYKVAYREGYTDDDIIVIEDKESGIRLSEEERNGLNKLKEHIANDSINCVIVYEVSRIARQERILYSIRDLLIENGIQLIVLNPSIRLLDKNNKMSPDAQMVFAIFSALSESEMRIKKERMLRGKRSKAIQGYYIGGPILFGYKLDENNKFIPHETQSDTVRKIYNLYLKKESVSGVTTELYGNEDLTYSHWKNTYSLVYKILIRPEYYGGHGVTTNVTYPPIIDKKLFDKVQELLHEKSRPHTKTKNIYYSHKLLRCRKDNQYFTPLISSCSYKYDCQIYFQDGQKHFRFPTWTVNMNLMDSILWYFTKKNYKSNKPKDIEKRKRQIESEIKKLSSKVDKGENDIKDNETKINRINKRIIEEKMNEEQGDRLIDEYTKDIMNLTENIKYWETKIFNLSCEYHTVGFDTQEKSLEDIKDDKEIYDLIHQCIKVVWVDRIDRGRYKFDLEYKDGTTVSFRNLPNNDNRILLENGKYEHFKRLNRFHRK